MNGKWAIITGASSGIGKALAFEFAAGGFHLVLIARNETALAEVAAECARRNRIEADIIAADLSRPDALDVLTSELASKPRRYEVLVNNAGFPSTGISLPQTSSRTFSS